MLTWSKVFPDRHLLRSLRAWCPYCYQEWRTNAQPIYEPLLWQLQVVNICPSHKLHLIEKCPLCHQTNIPLAWKSQPGYCSKCGIWLGYPLKSQPNYYKNLVVHHRDYDR